MELREWLGRRRRKNKNFFFFHTEKREKKKKGYSRARCFLLFRFGRRVIQAFVLPRVLPWLRAVLNWLTGAKTFFPLFLFFFFCCLMMCGASFIIILFLFFSLSRLFGLSLQATQSPSFYTCRWGSLSFSCVIIIWRWEVLLLLLLLLPRRIESLYRV